jgi:hypothetical protein
VRSADEAYGQLGVLVFWIAFLTHHRDGAVVVAQRVCGYVGGWQTAAEVVCGEVLPNPPDGVSVITLVLAPSGSIGVITGLCVEQTSHGQRITEHKNLLGTMMMCPKTLDMSRVHLSMAPQESCVRLFRDRVKVTRDLLKTVLESRVCLEASGG